MQLASFLDARTLFVEQHPKTREEIYLEMVSRICKVNPLPVCEDRLVELILERDQQSSTAYPTGLAIPHVRMEGLNDTVLSICILAHPIDYDGTSISMIVLIITDKSASKIYLNIVAALLKLSKDTELMAMLRAVHDGQELLTTIKKLGIMIKDDLCVHDIMTSNPVTIGPDAKLKELGNVMSEHDVEVLAVVDELNNYLGEVGVINLLKVGVPDYLMMIDNLNFLSNFEPLEHLFEKEDIVSVREIMYTDHTVVAPSTSIIEAVTLMIKFKCRFLAVVDEGKLVGVLTAMDVFSKIFKA